MHHPGHFATVPCFHRWKSFIAATVFLATTFAAASGRSAFAQNDDIGKEIANGLLRALIESQLERHGHRSLPPGTGQVPKSIQVTPEMQQIRRLLVSVALESATLSTLLNTDARRTAQFRSLIPDALNFQATANVSQQHADRENNHLLIQVPIQSLDQSWKPLAYQLSTTPGLSVQIHECVERINRLNAQLCQILNIREQFNSRKLVRAADLLTADLQTLTDEVSYAGPTAGNRNPLLFRLKKLQEQAALFANLAARGAQFQNVVIEYQNLYQAWKGLRPELDQFSARSVSRTVGRIQETHRQVHELLRLEFGLDQALVSQMADGLQRDITDLYRSITLDQMLNLPDSHALPASADALIGTAQNLADIVTRGESLQSVGEAWVYLDEQWQLFDFYVKPVQALETRRKLEGVSQSIESLQAAIGVTVVFDRHAILQQTASIESMADQLQRTVRSWLGRPGQQNPTLTVDVQGLAERCRELQVLANSSRQQDALRRKCDEIITAWQLLRPNLTQCQTDERETIEQTIDDFIPALIHLRTMLEE